MSDVERQDRAPGSPPPRDAETETVEEPVVVGALFLSMVLLILVAGAWIVMFWTLLGR